MARISAETWANLFAIAGLAAFLGWEVTAPDWLQGGLFPLALGGLTLLCFLWLTLKGARTQAPAKRRSDEPLQVGRGLLVIASTLAMLAGAYLLHFLAAVVVFMLAVPFVLGYRRVVWIGFATLAMAGLLWLGDSQGILVLPAGTLFGWR